jgi:hypothetical protein
MFANHGRRDRFEHGPRRRGPLGPFAGAALCALVVVTVPSGDAWGSFSSQTINNANHFSAGTLQLQGQTSGSVNCYSTGTGSGGTVGTNDATCSGTPLPTGELTTGTVQSATTTLTSVGTANATGATVSLVSCGVAEVADSSKSANTGLIYGGITYGTTFTSPVHSAFTSTGITDSGATTSYVGTITSLTSPATFTLVAWVKTTSTTGGGLIGFSNVQPDTGSTSQDRMLWVEPSGVVAFGVQNSTTKAELASTVTVNNGNWHFVAASFSSAGLSLDVDGTTVTSTAITSATSYTGYWHLGWAGDSGWTNPGTDEYLAGSLFGVSVYGTVLSSTAVTTLEDAASASAYASDVTSDTPTGDWLLSDSGTVPYTGTIPALGNNQLCQRVLVDIQTTQGTTVACAYPSGTGACAATPVSTDLLSSLTSSTMAAPTSSAGAVTLLIRMVLASASAAGVLGLHLLPDLGFTVTVKWSAEVTYPSTTTLEM